MKIWITAALTIAGFAVTAQANLVHSDNFNRADTTRNADATSSIGANYELAQRAGQQAATAGILNNQVQFGQAGSGTVVNDPMLLYKGLSLGDTTVSGNSWTVSGQITTVDVVAGSLLYGLAFNHQSDGSFYAARMDTGTDTTVLQFVRFNKGGSAAAFASITHTSFLATSSPYDLTITSSAPGVFDYTMTGANITGSLSGKATDTVLKLNGGYAGFYMTAANNAPRFDNLSITVIPEPATLGLVGFVAAAALVARRFMLL